MPLLRRCSAVCLLAVTMFAVAFLLVGCASQPPLQDGSLLFSVLPHDGKVYVRFPVQQNSELAAVLVGVVSPDMKAKNVARVLERLGIVYACVSDSDVSASASGSFPKFALPLVLTKKNGWHKVKSDDIPVTENYYVPLGSEFKLAFPSSSIALAAKNVVPMLSAYESYDGMASTASSSSLFFQAEETSNSEAISFYVSDISSILSSLTASSGTLTLPFSDAWGHLDKTPPGIVSASNAEPVYDFEVFMSLSELRAVRPAMAALRIMFRAMGVSCSVEQFSDDIIRVFGVTITPESFAEILSKLMEPGMAMKEE